MKKKLFLLFCLIFSLLGFLWFKTSLVKADEVEDLQKKITEYEQQIAVLQSQKQTLSQQISLMDNQIKITALQITDTENKIKSLEVEIESLSGKIVRLEDSLNFISKILLQRLAQTYKSGRQDKLMLLLSSENFSDFLLKIRYLQKIQIHDRELLLSMEKTRTNYDDQKQLKEAAQKQMETLSFQLQSKKKELNVQIEDRKRLLIDTNGKEAEFQKLLNQARGELEAILGILEGNGTEKEIGKVSQGQRIASVISGSSCNSSGTHLHFMVVKDGQTQNPFSFLKSVDFENCSGSFCGSSDGDPVNLGGNWDWPLSPKIKIYQGYGYTWAISHTWVGRIYNFHNGVDLQGSSLEIKAPKSGTLYAGSFVGSCVLRYVRLHHDEGNFDTYYLHVNY